MRTSLSVPHRVVLPATPLIPAWHLRQALGASKAKLHLWRRDQLFPPFHRDGNNYYTCTDSVARWLEARGVKVVRQ